MPKGTTQIEKKIVKRLLVILILLIALSVSLAVVRQALLLFSRAYSHPILTEDFYPITATLTGSQEVPPNQSFAKGYARMVYSIETKQLLNVGISVSGIKKSDLTGSHIHLGAFGQNGEIIVDLGPVESWVEVSPYELRRNLASISFPQIYERILLEGGTYINIHTIRYPQGEIRGQLKVSLQTLTITPFPFTPFPTERVITTTPVPTRIPTITYFPTRIPTRTPTPIIPTPTPGLTSFQPGLGGDANCDGKVDLVDFSIWRISFTQRIPPPYVCPRDPDFNNDGKVNLVDFAIWLFNFLRRPGITATPFPTRIPTPTSLPITRFPSICPIVDCPLNCVQVIIDGCNRCNCPPLSE